MCLLEREGLLSGDESGADLLLEAAAILGNDGDRNGLKMRPSLPRGKEEEEEKVDVWIFFPMARRAVRRLMGEQRVFNDRKRGMGWAVGLT